MLTVAADSAARIDRVRGELVFILRGLRSTVAAGTGPVINRLVRAAADLGRARDAARLGGGIVDWFDLLLLLLLYGAFVKMFDNNR